MFQVNVDQTDPTDLHQQVAAEIRRAIADGEAAPGERLPPAKDLAAVIGVNTNTVLRALRTLRDEGLLEFRRGRGITVTATPDRGAVVAQAKALVSFARKHGYGRAELLELINTLGSSTSRSPSDREAEASRSLRSARPRRWLKSTRGSQITAHVNAVRDRRRQD